MSNHVCHDHKAHTVHVQLLYRYITCKQSTNFIPCTSYLYNFHLVNHFHGGQALLMYPHPLARVGGLLLMYWGKQTQCSHSDGSKRLGGEVARERLWVREWDYWGRSVLLNVIAVCLCFRDGEVQDVKAVRRSWCNWGEEKHRQACVDTRTSGQNNKDITRHLLLTPQTAASTCCLPCLLTLLCSSDPLYCDSW